MYYMSGSKSNKHMNNLIHIIVRHRMQPGHTGYVEKHNVLRCITDLDPHIQVACVAFVKIRSVLFRLT